MSGNPHVERFQELRVYQAAVEVSREIFRLSGAFPKEEAFALTSQIRRSARSTGVQIAEAWAKRRYAKHFVASSLTRMANRWRRSTESERPWPAGTSQRLMPTG